MIIYILDESFRRIGVIDDYESIIWTRRARAEGDFELYLRMDPALYSVLYGGTRYLVRGQDVVGASSYRNVMRLSGRGSSCEIKADVEDGVHMIIKGRDLKSVIYQRIANEQTVLSGTIPDIVTALLDRHVMNPIDTDRTLDIVRGEDDIFSPLENLTRQWTGDNLGEAIQELIEPAGMMFDVTVENGTMTFTLSEGVDRSFSQTANDAVVFSESFDNLISADFVHGQAEAFANAAYVGGEGEGSARTVVGVGSATGIDRSEMWIDARNSSSNDGEITEAEYKAQLKQEGAEAIAEAAENSADTFDAELDLIKSQFKLGEDFYLNDIVQIKSAWASAARRVVEITESIGEDGTKTTLAKFA